MPNMAQYGQLAYVMRCVCESMRLYPHPPVLLRRAKVADTLPGGYEVGFVSRRGRLFRSNRWSNLWSNLWVNVCSASL